MGYNKTLVYIAACTGMAFSGISHYIVVYTGYYSVY